MKFTYPICSICWTSDKGAILATHYYWNSDDPLEGEEIYLCENCSEHCTFNIIRINPYEEVFPKY